MNREKVVAGIRYPFRPTGVDIYNFSITGEKSRCLSTSGGGLNEHIPVVIESALPIAYDARGNGGGGVVNTITGDHENRITDYTSVVVSVEERRAQHEDDCEGNEVFYEAYQHHGWRESVVAGTLTADQNNGVRGDTPVIVMATQQGGAEIAVNFRPTITAAAGMSGNNQPVVCFGECVSESLHPADTPKIFGISSFGAYKESVETLRASGGDLGGGSENLLVMKK